MRGFYLTIFFELIIIILQFSWWSLAIQWFYPSWGWFPFHLVPKISKILQSQSITQCMISISPPPKFVTSSYWKHIWSHYHRTYCLPSLWDNNYAIAMQPELVTFLAPCDQFPLFLFAFSISIFQSIFCWHSRE